MSQQLTVELPDAMFSALSREAQSEGKSLEQLTLECVRQRVMQPARGTMDAVLPYKGSWKMTGEERAKIEQMLYEERHREIEDE